MIFDRLGKIIVKRYKAILVLWIIILAISIPLAIKSNNVVSYQQQSSGTTGTTDSEKAQAILDEQFPKTISNSTFLIVIQADNMSSPQMRAFMLEFEQRVRSDPKITYMEQGEPGAFPKGFISVYTAERYILIQAVSGFNAGLYMTEGGVNQTAYMLFGVPAMHAQNWATLTNVSANVTTRDSQAYGITAAAVGMMIKGMDPATAAMTSGYFQAFMGAWNATAQVPALAADPFARADQSVRSAAPVFISSMPLPAVQAQLMGAVANAFSVKTFSSHAAVHAFSVGVVAAGAHITDMTFLEGVYGLGPLSALTPANQLSKASAFVDQKVLPNGTLDTYPIVVPAELRSGFLSPDNTVTIVSVGFSKGDEYTESNGTKPIVENVAEFRAILKDMRSTSNISGLHTYVSGGAAISSDLMSSAFGDMSIIEFVTIPLLIILMGIFFRSVLTPVLPLGAVMIAMGISQAMMFMIGTFIAPVSSEISTMLFVILMGVGTDYSIFIVARFREERIKGATRAEAVQTSVTWAGESIATSGATVMIAFFSLGIANYQMIKIMGMVLGLSILMALLIALTLVPSLLMLVGKRIFWPNNKERFKRYAARIMERRRKKQHGYFYKAARFSVRNAKAVMLMAILISVPTAYISLTTETSYDFIGTMPAVESTKGMDVMTTGFGAGRIMPSTVVLVFGSDVLQPDGNLSAANLAIVEAVSARIAARAIVHEVTGPSRPYGVTIDYAHPANISVNDKQKASEFIGQDNRTVRLSFVLNAEPMSNEAVNAVTGLRSAVRDTVSGTGVKAYVGGSTAGMYDVKLQMDDQFRQMEIVVVIGIFVVLLLVLSSLALPAFAIVSIGLSITWSFAATYLIFGWWLHVPILFMVPLILFIMLMGLGMDYNIFILTRIREEVAKGKDNETAIVDAVDWTGGIITALAIIMGGAIGALMLSSTKMLAEFGFALSFAILLDAMVVRTYIVPATMKLLGKWNWYAPGALGRLRRTDGGKAAKGSAKKPKDASEE
jgi:RND superfamily putative drug exporter